MPGATAQGVVGNCWRRTPGQTDSRVCMHRHKNNKQTNQLSVEFCLCVHGRHCLLYGPGILTDRRKLDGRDAEIITISSSPGSQHSPLLPCGHLSHYQCVELILKKFVTKMFCPLVSLTCLKTGRTGPLKGVSLEGSVANVE